MTAQVFYPCKNKAPQRERGNVYTHPVLIDIDGTRKRFVIGAYHEGRHGWVVFGLEPVPGFDLAFAKWAPLPLAVYEGEPFKVRGVRPYNKSLKPVGLTQ
jgi:hypothetical protein